MVVNDEIGEALDAVTVQRPDEYLASSGVLLKLKKVAPMIVNDAGRLLKPPRVPLIQVEGKSRPEENLTDPDYLEAMEAYEMERGNLATAVYLALGTEAKALPADGSVPAADDDSWIETLHDLVPDLEIAESGRKRYLAWLKYVVLTSPTDLSQVTMSILRLSAVVSEADVEKALKSVRDNAGRGSDNGVLTTAESPSGNHHEGATDPANAVDGA